MDPAAAPSASTADAALAAYRAERGSRNANRRHVASALLTVIAAIMLAVFSRPELGMLGVQARLDPQQLAPGFLYLLCVAAVGVLMGRRPLFSSERAQLLLDNGWIALMLLGAPAFALLNLPMQDVSAYAAITLTVATYHCAERRYIITLQSMALLGAFIAIAASAPSLSAQGLYLLSHVAISAASIYVGVFLEDTARREFVARYALAVSIRDLEERSAQLTQANESLARSNRELEERSAELTRLNTDLESHSDAIEQANRQLEQLAMTDPLTGMANRRQLFEALDREFARCRRYGNELAIALIDLDDFGRLNKVHGVLTGDEVLSELARHLREHVRGVDLVARYGGEEFVVLLPDSTVAAAHALMERVRQFIARTPLGSRGINLTFSAGIAGLQPGDSDPVGILHRADAALRQAKAEGKNRVLIAP